MSSKTLLPHPVPGALGEYSTKSSERSRHIELNKAVKKHGYKSTILDLNLRATLNKNQAPDAAKVMRKDMDYLRARGKTPKSKKSKKSRKLGGGMYKGGNGKSRKSRKSNNRSRKSRK